MRAENGGHFDYFRVWEFHEDGTFHMHLLTNCVLPYTEYINETYKTNLQFFDSKSYKSIAKALLNMENICSSIILPDWTTLNYYNWQFLSHFIYREIIDFII